MPKKINLLGIGILLLMGGFSYGFLTGGVGNNIAGSSVFFYHQMNTGGQHSPLSCRDTADREFYLTEDNDLDGLVDENRIPNFNFLYTSTNSSKPIALIIPFNTGYPGGPSVPPGTTIQYYNSEANMLKILNGVTSIDLSAQSAFWRQSRIAHSGQRVRAVESEFLNFERPSSNTPANNKIQIFTRINYAEFTGFTAGSRQSHMYAVSPGYGGPVTGFHLWYLNTSILPINFSASYSQTPVNTQEVLFGNYSFSPLACINYTLRRCGDGIPQNGFYADNGKTASEACDNGDNNGNSAVQGNASPGNYCTVTCEEQPTSCPLPTCNSVVIGGPYRNAGQATGTLFCNGTNASGVYVTISGLNNSYQFQSSLALGVFDVDFGPTNGGNYIATCNFHNSCGNTICSNPFTRTPPAPPPPAGTGDLYLIKVGMSYGGNDLLGGGDDSPTTGTPGETIRYTLNIGNSGTADYVATANAGPYVIDYLPNEVCMVVGSIRSTSIPIKRIVYHTGSTTDAYAPTEAVDCQIRSFTVFMETMNSGSSTQILFDTVLKDPQPNILTNYTNSGVIACIAGFGPGPFFLPIFCPETTTNNNSSTYTMNLPMIDLILLKDGVSFGPDGILGTMDDSTTTISNTQTARYTLNYQHVGARRVAGEYLEDTLPTEMCFVVGSIGNLPPSSTVTYSNALVGPYTYVPVGPVDCNVRRVRIDFGVPLGTQGVMDPSRLGTGVSTLSDYYYGSSSKFLPNLCTLSSVIVLDPGTDTLPLNLLPNTLYLLNSGTHIQTKKIEMGGCSVIAGSGKVNLVTSVQLGAGIGQINIQSPNNIVDNVAIDGLNNGVGGTHTRNYIGINIYTGARNVINNVHVFNQQNGITIASDYNHIRHSAIYNNTTNGGILIFNAGANILNNLLVYSNNTDGIKIHAQNDDARSNYISNSNIFNNNRGVSFVAEYLGSSTVAQGNLLYNSLVYNNTNGIYVEGDNAGGFSTNRLANVSIYNNTNGIAVAMPLDVTYEELGYHGSVNFFGNTTDVTAPGVLLPLGPLTLLNFQTGSITTGSTAMSCLWMTQPSLSYNPGCTTRGYLAISPLNGPIYQSQFTVGSEVLMQRPPLDYNAGYAFSSLMNEFPTAVGMLTINMPLTGFVTFNAQATSVGSTPIVNTGYINEGLIGYPEITETNNTDNHIFTPITGVPTITIVKTGYNITLSHPTMIASGNYVNYSLRYSNIGTVVVESGTIADILPPQICFVSGTLSGIPAGATIIYYTGLFTNPYVRTAGVDCNVRSYVIQVPTWNLPVGGSGTVMFSGRVLNDPLTNQTNTGCITVGVQAGVAGPTRTCSPYTMTPIVPSLTIVKTGFNTSNSSPTIIDSGHIVRYNLHYSNNGVIPVTDGTIADILPPGLCFISGSLSGLPAGSSIIYYSGNFVSPYIPTAGIDCNVRSFVIQVPGWNLPAGGSGTVVFSGFVNGLPVAGQTNTGCITVGIQAGVAGPSWICSPYTMTPPAPPPPPSPNGSLTIIKTGFNTTQGLTGQAGPLDYINYYLQYTNNGLGIVNTGTIADILPPDVCMVVGSLNTNALLPASVNVIYYSGYFTGVMSTFNGPVDCDIRSFVIQVSDWNLPAGRNGIVSFSGRVNNLLTTNPITNTGCIATGIHNTVTGTNRTCSPYPMIPIQPQLQIIKTGYNVTTSSPSVAITGQTVRYYLNYSNVGTSAVISGSIGDHLPVGACFVSGSLNLGILPMGTTVTYFSGIYTNPIIPSGNDCNVKTFLITIPNWNLLPGSGGVVMFDTVYDRTPSSSGMTNTGCISLSTSLMSLIPQRTAGQQCSLRTMYPPATNPVCNSFSAGVDLYASSYQWNATCSASNANGSTPIRIDCGNGQVFDGFGSSFSATCSYNGYGGYAPKCIVGVYNSQCNSTVTLRQSGGGGGPYCGDGVLNYGEDCDDGSRNGTTGSYCSRFCRRAQPTMCGDFVVNSAGEQCDQGPNGGIITQGLYSGQVCNNACTVVIPPQTPVVVVPPKCTFVDPPAVMIGEYFPFRWKLENLQNVTYSNSCTKPGDILRNTMTCVFNIYDGRGGGRYPINLKPIKVPCFNPSGLANIKLFQKFIPQATKNTDGNSFIKMDRAMLGTNFALGEYVFKLVRIDYDVCGTVNGQLRPTRTWYDRTVCEMYFTVTKPYGAMKKTSSNSVWGVYIPRFLNLTAQKLFELYRIALQKYPYNANDVANASKTLVNTYGSKAIQKDVYVKDYKYLDNAGKLYYAPYREFTQYFSVNAPSTVMRVPNQFIYMIDAKGKNVVIKDKGNIERSYMLIVKNGNLIIKDDLKNNGNGMFVVPDGKIIFGYTNPASCKWKQLVEGIFIAGKGFDTYFAALGDAGIINNDLKKSRCDLGGLQVNGILLGNGVNDTLMGKRRGVLNIWYVRAVTQAGSSIAKLRQLIYGSALNINENEWLRKYLPPGTDKVMDILKKYRLK